MKTNVPILLTFLLVGYGFFSSHAQYNEISAPFPSLIGQPIDPTIKVDNSESYIPYPFVDEDDILWKKTVWEYIELPRQEEQDEKNRNNPLYYPTINNGFLSDDRISLFRVLLDGIENREITEIYRTYNFNERLTIKEIRQNLNLRKLSDFGITKLNAGETLTEDDYDIYEIQSGGILQYWIKGIWYFSERLGSLKYQIIGIAPVAPDVTTLDDPNNQGTNVSEDTLVPLFWVWYRDARKVLSQHKVYVGDYWARLHSYDDYLISRQFHSVIYAVENVFNNQTIREYLPEDPEQRLLESERIKESIRNFGRHMEGQ
ncbi:MAG: gliding motility protein GldN [Flavobacteriaceae bacterium]|nr:gliding motility protein GldN [Flavobacteriaceae bacterium]MCY4253624.1 gliding motility protein GldN [Flavobacteriaceae bacterium]